MEYHLEAPTQKSGMRVARPLSRTTLCGRPTKGLAVVDARLRASCPACMEAAGLEPITLVVQEPRRGDWQQTFTGRQFWPIDPRPEEVYLEDVAHALAHQCRFAGHTPSHYSVAQHSILVSQLVEGLVRARSPRPSADGVRGAALLGLMHDAAEAYLVDVPQPIKPELKDYKPIELRLEEAIAERFGLDIAWWGEVKHADAVVLATERRDLMASAWDWQLTVAPDASIRIEPWTAAESKARFLARYAALAVTP